MNVKKNSLSVIILFFSVLLFSANLMAQESDCMAKAPSEVAVDRQFKYTVTTSEQGEVLSSDFGKFEMVSGPSIGTSTSISFVNGTMDQSTTYTYNYYLVAHKEGTFTIPGISLSIDGRVVKSNPVVVSVVKAPKVQEEPQEQADWFHFDFDFPQMEDFPQWSDFFQPRSGAEPQQDNAKPKSKSDKAQIDDHISKDDIFIKAFSSKLEAYQGEAVVVTHKLYIKTQNRGYSIERAVFDPTDAFWTGALDLNQRDESTETVNGKTYTVYTIKKTAFYPTKTGKVTIPKLNLTLRVRVPATVRDPFWGTYSTYKSQDVSLVSNDIAIKAKPMPNSRSAETDVVGNFTVTSSLNKSEIRVNEAVVLTVTLSGTGNLHRIGADDLNIDFPADCDVTYPKVTGNISAKGDIVSGSKTFKYTIIPRSEGTFRIPGASYQYYDYDSGSYKTITSQDYQIEVGPAREPTSPSENSEKKSKPAKTYKI